MLTLLSNSFSLVTIKEKHDERQYLGNISDTPSKTQTRLKTLFCLHPLQHNKILIHTHSGVAQARQTVLITLALTTKTSQGQFFLTYNILVIITFLSLFFNHFDGTNTVCSILVFARSIFHPLGRCQAWLCRAGIQAAATHYVQGRYFGLCGGREGGTRRERRSILSTSIYL